MARISATSSAVLNGVYRFFPTLPVTGFSSKFERAGGIPLVFWLMVSFENEKARSNSGTFNAPIAEKH